MASLIPAPAGSVDAIRPPPAGLPFTTAQAAALQEQLQTVIAGAATLRGAHVGVLVEDTGGHVLFERNADDAFQPASTLKLLVGSVALDRLGPGYRFTTTLSRVPVSATPGGLDGLVLRGGGDPLLAAPDLEAAATAAAGANLASPVTVVIDESHVPPSERSAPGWSIDDRLTLADAVVVNGLPFAHNELAVGIDPGPTVGSPAVIALPPPLESQAFTGCRPGPNALVFLDRARTVAAGAPSTADTAAGRCGEIDVFGDVPLGAPKTVSSLIDLPEVVAWETLAGDLRRHGLTVAPALSGAGPMPGIVDDAFMPSPLGTVIWRHDSVPLTQMLAAMWEPSDNLVAEELLHEIAFAATDRPGTAPLALDLERAWLRALGVDPATVTLADGSGLSQYDRITPRALAAILLHDWYGPNRDAVLDALPVAGVRGTQADQMLGTPAAGRVFAKDGAMRHIRGLAGYVATRTHGTLVFVVSVDDWMGASADLNAFRAAFCSRLAMS